MQRVPVGVDALGGPLKYRKSLAVGDWARPAQIDEFRVCELRQASSNRTTTRTTSALEDKTEIIMAIVTLTDVSLRYRGPNLLDGVSSRIEAGQRIGLLGRNGAGKSTLLRLIAGQEMPDSGTVQRATGLRIAQLEQDVPTHLDGLVRDVVLGGTSRTSADEAEAGIESWQLQHRAEQMLSRMQLDGSAAFERQSAGMQRRVLLARALAGQPDLLLLDEPTNHLDIDAIIWLEDFLLRWNGALVFVTHDRRFLQQLATRIWEIDRGHLFDWSCDYRTFLARKEASLEAELRQEALFDKQLAREEAWIRQGIKARRTRNEGRVRRLQEMRRMRRDRQERVGRVDLQIDDRLRSGQLVIRASRLHFAYGDQTIIQDFSTTVMRGDKVGIVGPNGCGKTTLLNLLLGRLPPQSGKLKLGTQQHVAFFDQLRETLHPEQTVAENVGQGSDTVLCGGRKQHVIGYLQQFLFSPEQTRTPVRFLSGGERNRVLLARLLAQPANLLVLDEPTNDLDIETMELLEQRLVDFSGTLLLVSHDREFINNVVTSTIAFEPAGPREYAGGYDDWLSCRHATSESTGNQATGSRNSSRQRSGGARRRELRNHGANAAGQESGRRLSFKEQRELVELPGRIESLESDVAQMHASMASPDFYRLPAEEIAAQTAHLKQLEADLATAYYRWEELDNRS